MIQSRIMIVNILLITLFVLTLSFCKKEKKLPDDPIVSPPEDFVINENVLVKYIGDSKDVVIPDGITTIDNYAFAKKQLNSVIIPEGVIYIRANAFNGNQLTSVTIPGTVTSIGEGAFADNKLTNVTIPNSVTSIG